MSKLEVSGPAHWFSQDAGAQNWSQKPLPPPGRREETGFAASPPLWEVELPDVPWMSLDPGRLRVIFWPQYARVVCGVADSPFAD